MAVLRAHGAEATSYVLCPGGCGQEFTRTDYRFDPPPIPMIPAPSWQIDGDWQGSECPRCGADLEADYQAARLRETHADAVDGLRQQTRDLIDGLPDLHPEGALDADVAVYLRALTHLGQAEVALRLAAEYLSGARDSLTHRLKEES